MYKSVNKPSRIYPWLHKDPFFLLQAAVLSSAPCSTSQQTDTFVPKVFPEPKSCPIWAKHNITVPVVSTWVSGPVPGCSTAQVRACFALRQQLPGCHTPTTHPYLKMHLYFQQLLVELRVLQDMVSMANTLSLQGINCLESTGKALRASKHSSAPACSIPLQGQPTH